MKRSWMVSFATLGPIGNLKGCGTVATLLTLPAAIALDAYALPWQLSLTVLLAVCCAALIIVHHASSAFPGDHDPAAIVLDEVVGCLVTFYGIPINGTTLILGFVLFRLLDIFKPAGIDWLERCTGPLGIVIDDVVAAMVANILVRIVMVWL